MASRVNQCRRVEVGPTCTGSPPNIEVAADEEILPYERRFVVSKAERYPERSPVNECSRKEQFVVSSGGRAGTRLRRIRCELRVGGESRTRKILSR